MLERGRRVRRSDIPACSSSHSRSPGSTLPERVAITSPSSGVKPIVVSTERPAAIAHSDAPAPRWQLDDPQLWSTARAARERGGDPGVREPVEAVAAQRPALAPARRQRVGVRGRRQRGVERGVEAGDGRALGQRGRHRVERGERLRLVQRRESTSSRRPSSTAASISTGSRNRSPPWTIRWPTASASPSPSASAWRSSPASSAARGAASSRSTSVRRRRRAGQLEAARAGVDDEDAHARALQVLWPGQVQSRMSGGSSPCSRV